jgi:hypothetical protein
MSSPGSPQKPETPSGSLAGGIVVLLVLVAVVVGIDYLEHPYYALAHLAIYGMMVFAVGQRLRACLRLAAAGEQSSRLYAVGFWLVLAVFGVLVRVGDLLQTGDRNYLHLATNLGVWLALWVALGLVERLLRDGPRHGEAEPVAVADGGGM